MSRTIPLRAGLDRRHLMTTSLAAGLALAAGPGRAQEEFPRRHITLVVPFAAGGSTDVLARLVADGMGRHLGQQVIVENVAGAGGTIGGKRVLQAAADGYTILIGNTGTLAAYSAFHKTSPYDSVADFTAISSVGDAPQLLVARSDFPANSLEEFATYAKANQEAITFGAAGAGSGSFLGGTLVNSRLGITVRAVNFRSSGDSLNAILSRNVDFMSESTTAALPFVQAGQMKAIAVLRPTRIDAAPEIRAAGESKHADMLYMVWNMIVAKRGTDEAILAKLHQSVIATLASDRFRERTAQLGIDIPSKEAQTPAGAQAILKTETQQWLQLLSTFKAAP